MKKLIFLAICLFDVLFACKAQNSNSALEYYGKGQVAMMDGRWEYAFSSFKAGADLGSEGCAYEVALCYERGEGTPVNYDKAFSYMYKAVTGKTPYIYGYVNLAKYYLYGLGTPQNYTEAFKWFYKGANELPTDNLNFAPDCMFYLGLCYTNGFGTTQDYTQAVYWYRRSAELGHPVAAMNLGNKYMNGQGVAKDEREAVRWWRQAAEADIPGVMPVVDAQYYMGLAYIQGIGGTPINEYIALQWFKKAAANGDSRSVTEIKKIEGK